MAIQTPSGNTTLLASQVANVLVQPLEQASTFLAAGPTIYDSASPVRIPRVASGASAAFTAAGAQIADSNATFDEVELLPSSMKGIKVLTKLSNELVRQSVVGLEAALRTRLVTDVANVLDAALWDGTGSSDTIKGIFRQTGIATGALDLTDPDSLIDAIATAQANKVNPTHWVMTAASFAKLRKLKVGTDDARYLFDPSTIQNGTAFQILGLPVVITDNIPNAGTAPGKARVGLVDFSHVAVARDVDAEVAILDQTFGDFDTIGIRVVTRFDVGLTQAKAVTLLTEA
ncbi:MULTISPECIES: phage major capsid protein [unclassified Mycolicibacterium]|uniref:phage major capsid protein n=1 Tax=unclassified Mycolicibacterium TaxID=2636767 RepID=UPI0012DD7961|nr:MULTISPECIES: phage major capsid protein [unclassified Mycolicibacterium]MUL85224.1 phage major capsid protein [Mycolicibacterium sp. CBMA 329]MUL91191.1 phage major capsid protein [Mycolicibacterium sp. CBMA 331]MUL98140.1 phage major capsid protein [Mycolicibacterium sp. CBMA 334]MUM25760.1 phage major capsid protein [Mycolicibacterium sp. CBMA 295]MUM40950.1 phage major capsid protein [Mycolicibacterium sp. CBMA 247]